MAVERRTIEKHETQGRRMQRDAAGSDIGPTGARMHHQPIPSCGSQAFRKPEAPSEHDGHTDPSTGLDGNKDNAERSVPRSFQHAPPTHPPHAHTQETPPATR